LSETVGQDLIVSVGNWLDGCRLLSQSTALERRCCCEGKV